MFLLFFLFLDPWYQLFTSWLSDPSTIISSEYASIPHMPSKFNPQYFFGVSLTAVSNAILKSTGDKVSPCQSPVLNSNSSDRC